MSRAISLPDVTIHPVIGRVRRWDDGYKFVA